MFFQIIQMLRPTPRLTRVEQKLDALLQLQRKTMTIVADVQTSLDKFKADFEAFKAGVADAIAKAVADAVAQDDSITADALKALKAEIDAMDAEIAPAPAPAPVEAPAA